MIAAQFFGTVGVGYHVLLRRSALSPAPGREHALHLDCVAHGGD